MWNAVLSGKSPPVVDAQSFFQVAKSLTTSVTVSLLTQKEMNDISGSLCLEKCFSEALPLPGISRFHCIEPQDDGSVNCCLYSFQSLIKNRPPDVYLYESDDSDSESFRDKISEDGEDEESDESDDGVKFVKVVPTKSPSCDTKGKADCPVKQGLCNELKSLPTFVCMPGV